MINAQFKDYNYMKYGQLDTYGQPTLSAVNGTINMAINLLSQSVEDNVLYSGAEYVGLTHDTAVNDTYVIVYGDDRLKVKYVNPFGRLNQVYMARM